MKKHLPSIGFFILIFLQVLGLSAAPAEADLTTLELRVAELMKLDNAARVRAIQDHGVEIYSVPIPGGKVQYFSMLPEIQPSLSRWAGEFADGSTAGLYLTPKNVINKVKVPTILLAEDAEPWALIHEFVHALLDEQRGADSTIHAEESAMVSQLEDAREDLNDLWWRYQQLKSFRSEDERSRILESFLTATKIERQLISVFQMEEILIEGILRRAFQKQPPADFKKETFEYSQRYIQKNAQSGIRLLGESLEKCPDLLSLAKALPQLRDQVEKSCQASQEMKEKILELEKAALR